ncbi:metabotropic glutamate receptor 3 [Trichonephila clavipes]|nr:metabotropic glutamate receptor 3 [Trichonephila clavipes]
MQSARYPLPPREHHLTTSLRWCRIARLGRNYSCSSRTDLHVKSVMLTGHIYRDVILEQLVRLFRGAMGAEFLFVDDNARPHRANILDECLQSEDITRMDRPAYSPDLNSVEHVWDMLGQRIAARQPPPTCLPELRRALLDEWCNIHQDQIDNLIFNMPRRFHGSDLAFVVVGSPEEIEAASSIISSLNVTTISVTDSIRLKNSISHHLQVAIPFEKKIKATVDTLRYLGWNYVTVIHDGDRRSTNMVESFKTYIKKSDICISVELSTSSIATDLEMDNIVKQVVAAKKKGARAVVMWTSERSTKAFLGGVHRAVVAGQISRGDLVISSGDWIVNLQSFKEFENEAIGVIVLKTQQGEVEDFATYYQRLQPEANKRNP